MRSALAHRRSWTGILGGAALWLAVGCGADDEPPAETGPEGDTAVKPDAGAPADTPAPAAPVDASPGSTADGSSPPAEAAPNTSTDSPATATALLLPWKEGNTWTYRVTGDGQVSMKVITVGALEPVGGTGPHKDDLANKTVTKKSATDQTISWQVALGDKVLRYREQSFGARSGELQLDEHWAPYKLHIDGTAEHTVAGASWVEEYQETKQAPNVAPVTATAKDAWSVDAVDQMITVPAGTFKAIVFIKGGGSNRKTYWYVRGVGKVKEIGGQTEELVSYEVKP